jgi:putative transposase
MNTTYPSDLSDSEWERLQHYLHESRSTCRTRRHSLLSILNAILYVLPIGCPWH